jgi:signal transduction histidine kinase/ActR/RegA family two-component response regulator
MASAQGNGPELGSEVAAPRLSRRGIAHSVNGQIRSATESRFHLLSQALETFAAPHRLKEALQSVAELVVSEFCDWCTIDIRDDDWTFIRVAVACQEPWAQLSDDLRAVFDPNEDAPLGLGKPPHTSRYSIYSPAACFISQLQRRDNQNGTAPELDNAKRRVLAAAQSALLVPILVDQKVVGGMTFVTTNSEKSFSGGDIALAEDLARAAGLALSNAELRSTAARERARAESLSLQKNEFLGTVSHELRTPLQAMLGWTQLLMDNKLKGAAATRALESLERNVKIQAQIVEDVLDVSRIGRGMLQLEIAPIDLRIIIQDAVASLRFTARARNIDLAFTHEISRPVTVEGDGAWLQRVFWNLLSNAIKFTPERGKVCVDLGSNDQHAVVRVKDNGKGISPEFLPHIFDGLRQHDGSTTRRYGGLGIGLTIARHITEAHGGTLEADSRGENLGSTFTVILPVSGRKGASDEPTAVALSSAQRQLDLKPALTGVRVLVVEDNAETREILGTLLEQSGAVVTHTQNAKDGLRIIKGGKQDVIISDIGMEGEDGYALIRHIRGLDEKHGGRTPALALTAFARSEDRIRALAAGFQMHIPKPVEPDELILAVSTLAAR